MISEKVDHASLVTRGLAVIHERHLSGNGVLDHEQRAWRLVSNPSAVLAPSSFLTRGARALAARRDSVNC
jgi:hypothetical protein